MSEAKHTPVTWTANGLNVEAFGRGVVAVCLTPQAGGVFECSANARLIAAAPELFHELLTSRCPGGGWNGMPKDLEPTVGACVSHGVCGCSAGRVIQKAAPEIAHSKGQSEP